MEDRSSNIYKLREINKFDMSPGDLNWLPDEFFSLGGKFVWIIH
jgi:hypothetical protein